MSYDHDERLNRNVLSGCAVNDDDSYDNNFMFSADIYRTDNLRPLRITELKVIDGSTRGVGVIPHLFSLSALSVRG